MAQATPNPPLNPRVEALRNGRAHRHAVQRVQRPSRLSRAARIASIAMNTPQPQASPTPAVWGATQTYPASPKSPSSQNPPIPLYPWGGPPLPNVAHQIQAPRALLVLLYPWGDAQIQNGLHEAQAQFQLPQIARPAVYSRGAQQPQPQNLLVLQPNQRSQLCRPAPPTQEEIREREHLMKGRENVSNLRKAVIAKDVVEESVIENEEGDTIVVGAPEEPEKEEDDPSKWVFMPDEMDEVYYGESWPDLYAYLNLKSDAPHASILPAYKRFLQQHFPCLRKPHDPFQEISELVKFFRWQLEELTPQELSSYRVPYRKFINILNAYREEWADRTTKMEFSRRGRYPKKMFEQILLAFLVLNDNGTRIDYDWDRKAKDAKYKTMFHNSTSRRNPEQEAYSIDRSVRADKLQRYRRRRMMYAERVPNVGVWVTRENAARLEAGRMWVLEITSGVWPRDFRKEEYEWEYHRYDSFVLVQREKRSCRTGWFAEIEEMADYGLNKMIAENEI